MVDILRPAISFLEMHQQVLLYYFQVIGMNYVNQLTELFLQRVEIIIITKNIN